MNEPKNFEEFRKHQLDNERTFDLHTEMLKELSTTLDHHTVILTGLQSDVTSIKSTVETRFNRLETAMATYEHHLQMIGKTAEISQQNQERILEKQILILQLLQSRE